MALQNSLTALIIKRYVWATLWAILGASFGFSMGGWPSIAQALELDIVTEEGAQVASSHPSIHASSTLLFVHPAIGDDESGAGTQRSPLRSLTRALDVAEVGTIIMLSPGIYNADNGEQFPIQLKSGVIVQGDPNHLGEGILIQGGGRFVSPAFAGQDVALLGADDAVLRGVTVTNPNHRGYGLWIESTSPIVERNTFSYSVHDGVSITGDSQAMVQGNHFYRNGANGITIYGTSQPEIQGNVFEDTGFGINMGQKAAPYLMDNRLWNNRSGIVVQGESRPILRRNVVEFNEQDGLVAIADSRPDLGLSDDPGQNRFSDNGQADINAEVAVHPIIAVGNTLDLSRVLGQVQTTMPQNRIASFPRSLQPSTLTTDLELAPDPFPHIQSERALPKADADVDADASADVEISLEIESGGSLDTQHLDALIDIMQDGRPEVPVMSSLTDVDVPILPRASSSREENVAPEITIAAPTVDKLPESPLEPTQELTVIGSDLAGVDQDVTPTINSDLEEGGVEIPIIFPGENRSNPLLNLLSLSSLESTNNNVTSQEASAINRAAPETFLEDFERKDTAPDLLPSVAIPATSAPFPSNPASPSIPDNLLPVPGILVPEGHLGNLSTLPVQSTALNTALLAATPFNPTSTRTNELRYRVLVEVDSHDARVLVNSIAPDAFFTQVRGRSMMQIGAYHQFNNANDIAYQLVEQGLQVEVQRID
ncbi:MAG: DUF1565 domain-containing protein [Cyanobacteria bacterium P01_F01_bin.150]